MKVCYFGTYEQNYPRNRIIINGLEKNNVEVVECHVPLWELTEDKGGKFSKDLSLLKLCFQMLWSYLRLIIKYLRVGDYDVMIVGYIGQFDMILAWILTKIGRKPLIFNPLVSLSDTLVSDRKLIKKASLFSKLLFLIDRSSLILADLILLDTNEHINYFCSEFNLPRKKLNRVFAGADERYFFSQRKTNKADGSFVVLFFGKFTPLHGIEYIVKAAKLLEQYEDISFEIIGKGQLTKEIAKLVDELQIGNIKFIPWVRYQTLPDYIERADVCLGIFGNSGKAMQVIPNKAFQALAMAKPLITGDSAAAREILADKENAILCKMGDAEAIAQSILLLREDAGLKKKISENGHKLFRERLSVQALGRDSKKYLDDLLVEKA